MGEVAPFKLRHHKTATTGPDELWSTLDYEGPFGPLHLVKDDDRCLVLTGASIGRASLCIPSPEGPPPASREDDYGPGAAAGVTSLGPILQGHLRQGIYCQIGDAQVRLHQPRRGLLRSARTLMVDRGDRTAVVRNRGLATLSLETADGARLMQRGRPTTGKVWAAADAIDVAVFLLVDASLGSAVAL